MNATHAVAAAIIFTWLGMVIAISFIEAPLKFRAPGVTLPIGLGIGRLVFRALNTIEAILAAILLMAIGYAPPSPGAVVACGVACAALVGQLVAVRPRLTRRSDMVLSGRAAAAGMSRSRTHYSYLGLELVKVLALLAGGTAVLAG